MPRLGYSLKWLIGGITDQSVWLVVNKQFLKKYLSFLDSRSLAHLQKVLLATEAGRVSAVPLKAETDVEQVVCILNISSRP